MSIPNPGRALAWRGYLALFHLGPSVVCTSVTVLAGWSAAPQAKATDPGPPAWRARLVVAGVAMALAQMSTGVLNDAFDAPWDRSFQDYKPIAAGLVPRWQAWLLGFSCGATSLLVARVAGVRALRLTAVGLACGWSYSLGLSRTPAAFVPFALGLSTVPLLGPATIGARLSQPGAVVGLGTGIGLGLHLANGGPDIERDRLAGRRSLPALLGVRRSRALSHLLLGGGALAVAVDTTEAGRRWGYAGAGLSLVLVAVDRLAPRSARGRGDRPFVIPALAAAVLAAGWLLGQARAAHR